MVNVKKQSMTFKRYEIKYKLSTLEYEKMKEFIDDYMTLDKYGKHNIANVYFDTNDFQIIRKSIEKPVYKEKLRVRQYNKDKENVFIELKKKYKGIVYKRRICMCQDDVKCFFEGEIKNESQISKEIEYFVKCYNGIKPSVNLSYDREAYFGKDDRDFRMTFDTNIKMSQVSSNEVNQITQDVIMEVKTPGGLPSWLTDYLSKNKIYKASFSKYGVAYKNFIIKKEK